MFYRLFIVECVNVTFSDDSDDHVFISGSEHDTEQSTARDVGRELYV